MNYLESIVYLESLSPTLQKPCLERIEAFMNESGNWQDRFESIHIGGTNGKGSTVAMLDSVLRQSDLKVGRFTGPHLLRWNERFHVDGIAITDDRFAELATRLRAMSEDFGRRHSQFGPLTWFEFLAAMAFVYFAESKVDIAVVEVGLGGRWDATNVLSAPLATAITNVDLDHTQILGETVQAIAREKSGIVKAGCPVITGATGHAFDEILRAAQSAKAPLYRCVPPDVIAAVHPENQSIDSSELSEPAFAELLEARSQLSLAGSHQQSNALIALSLLKVAGLADRLSGTCGGIAIRRNVKDVVAEGLSKVYWPGRLQLLDDLSMILDGAHNPAGALALRASLAELFPDKRFLFVVGCFQNKDVPAYIENLVHADDRMIACEASTRRAVFGAEQLVALTAGRNVQSFHASTVKEALDRALSERKSDEMIVVTGSFATVREVMLELGWQRVEDGMPATRMSWAVSSSARF